MRFAFPWRSLPRGLPSAGTLTFAQGKERRKSHSNPSQYEVGPGIAFDFPGRRHHNSRVRLLDDQRAVFGAVYIHPAAHARLHQAAGRAKVRLADSIRFARIAIARVELRGEVSKTYRGRRRE